MKMSLDDAELRREGKVCSVCGDAALGYNFNAVTCESCKAFFRRNATKDKELKCQFKSVCDVTPVTRRFCQKCRLDKCFRVGMKRELIMSDEDKERKRKKRNEKCPQQELNVSSTEGKRSCDASVQTDFPCCSSAQKYLQPLSASPIGHYFTPPITPPPHVEEMCGTPLSSDDKIILNEIVSATKALEAPVDQDMTLLGEEFKNCGSEKLIDVINLTSIAIRRLIKMCKRIWGFKTLSQSDQLSLLKQSCTQMLLLRSVLNFDPEKNSWKIPHSNDGLARIKVDILKEARGNLYEAHESWLKSFDQRASRDPRVIGLLTAIALFDPSRANLLNRDTIKTTQDRYYLILCRYLESLYRVSEAREIYNGLIDKMTELRDLNDEYVRVYLNVDPSHVEPLLIEIFDLKSH